MDILGVCSIALDTISIVDHLPILDSFCTVLNTQKLHGGSGANVMVQVHKSKANAGIITQVAMDSDSDLILDNLSFHNIDQRGVYRNPAKDGKAPSCLIYVDPNGEKELVLDKPSALAPLGIENMNLELMDEANIVYFDLNPADVTPELIKLAKEKGKHVVLNIQDNIETVRSRNLSDQDLLAFLPYLDIFAPCQEGIRGLSGKSKTEDQIQYIRQYYQGLIVLTLGTKGLIAIDENNQEYHLPAFNVDAIDTTGAGDSFIGAFMVSYLVKKLDLSDALQYASAAAALTCTKMGAQSSPTDDEITNFLKQQTM